MTKRVTPLLEDPTATSDVRELLQSAREAQVLDYDYGSGLERHVAQVQAGAPMPEWAKGLEGSSGMGGATAVAGTSIVGWLALPVAIVAVASAVVWLTQREPDAPAEVAGTGRGAALGEQAAASTSPAGAEREGDVAGDSRSLRDRADTARSARVGEAQRNGVRHRGALAARVEPAKRALPAAGTRPSSKPGAAAAAGAKPGSTGSGASPDSADDLFAGSPVATATRADNVARTTAGTAVGASHERAGSDVQQAPSEQGSSRAEAKPEPAQLDDTRLEREMGMLSVAQRVLHSDPARSLSLARQGEREFAGSMFTQERQQVELLALVKLGRLDEAKRLARPYLARYPNGPFSDRVRRALATGRVER